MDLGPYDQDSSLFTREGNTCSWQLKSWGFQTLTLCFFFVLIACYAYMYEQHVVEANMPAHFHKCYAIWQGREGLKNNTQRSMLDFSYVPVNTHNNRLEKCTSITYSCLAMLVCKGSA